MPIYEYKCKTCERQFELLRSFREGQTPARCPACGSEQTNRLLSMFAAPAADNAGSDTGCGWNEAAGACFKGG